MDFPPFHLRIDIGNLGDNMYRMDTYICSAGGVRWRGVGRSGVFKFKSLFARILYFNLNQS